MFIFSPHVCDYVLFSKVVSLIMRESCMQTMKVEEIFGMSKYSETLSMDMVKPERDILRWRIRTEAVPMDSTRQTQ